MSPVSKHIKRLRLQEGLTQEALAEKLFVSRQTISNWETGKSQPDLETLVQIAEALKTDATVLIYGPPDTLAQRKARLRLLIPGGLLTALGVGLRIFYPMARSLTRTSFVIGPQLLMQLWLIPAFWLLLGCFLIHGADAIGLLKPPQLKHSRMIWLCVLAFPVLYVIVILPWSVELVSHMVQQLHYRQNRALYPDGFQTVQFLPDLLLKIPLLRVIDALAKQPAVFIIPGVLLRLFRPNKPTK